MKTLLSTWAIAGTLGVSLASATARRSLETVRAAATEGLILLDSFDRGFSDRLRGL